MTTTYRLTAREEEVMLILWRLKQAFVNDIIAEMLEPKPPYNTISSVVRKLEAEGMIGHEGFGKTYRYYPVLKQHVYRRNMIKSYLKEYFDGSPKAFLSYFVKENGIAADDIQELIDDIKNKKR
jgi:predicted transcriptional regulator